MTNPKDYNKKTREMLREKGMAADTYADSDEEFEKAKRKKIAAMNAISRELDEDSDEDNKRRKTDKYYAKKRSNREDSRSESPRESRRSKQKKGSFGYQDEIDSDDPTDYYE